MRKYLSVIVFLCVIFGFTIGSAVVPSKKFSEMEKRNLQQKPKVSVSSVVKGSYQKKYEKYLSDQFFLRDKWVNIYAQLEKNTGKKEINSVRKLIIHLNALQLCICRIEATLVNICL